MLGSRLAELRATRRTLRKQKQLVSFVEDETLDAGAIRMLIGFSTPYTNAASLRFERARLSEVEEQRFNRKFSAFLKSLLPRMDEPSIDYCLEYLVRVYSADTFNAADLLFLLLPFRKYESQILALNEAVATPMMTTEQYSARGIARALIRSARGMRTLCAYAQHYAKLTDFMSAAAEVLEEAARMHKDAFPWQNELHAVLSTLFEGGQGDAALNLCQRMAPALCAPEFTELVRRHTGKELHNAAASEPEPLQDVFSAALRHRDGRRFLSEPALLPRYLTAAASTGIVPTEFTEEELALLKELFCGAQQTPLSSVQPFQRLFTELRPRCALIRRLLPCHDFELLCPLMNDEDRLIVLSEAADDAARLRLLSLWMNNANHSLLLRNLPPVFFKTHYRELFARCAFFPDFEVSLFPTFACPDLLLTAPQSDNCAQHTPAASNPPTNRSSDIFYTNVTRHARFTNHALLPDILDVTPLPLPYLRYALEESVLFTASERRKLMELATATADVSIWAAAAQFLLRHASSVKASPHKLISEFIQKAVQKGYVAAATPFVSTHPSLFSDEQLLGFLSAGSESKAVLSELDRRGALFVEAAYNARDYHLLGRIAQQFGAERLLVPHPLAVSYAATHPEMFSVERAVEFAVHALRTIFGTDSADSVNSADETDNTTADVQNANLIVNDAYSACLRLLLDNLPRLPAFRASSEDWPLVWPILMEAVETQALAQLIIDAVVDAHGSFATAEGHVTAADRKLFAKLCGFPVSLALCQIKRLAGPAGAVLVDVALRNKRIDELPALPFIAPLLIKHDTALLVAADGTDTGDSTFVRLCKSHGRVMSPYAGMVVEHAPRHMHALRHADPRVTLPLLLKEAAGSRCAASAAALFCELARSERCANQALAKKLVQLLVRERPCGAELEEGGRLGVSKERFVELARSFLHFIVMSGSGIAEASGSELLAMLDENLVWEILLGGFADASGVEEKAAGVPAWPFDLAATVSVCPGAFKAFFGRLCTRALVDADPCGLLKFASFAVVFLKCCAAQELVVEISALLDVFSLLYATYDERAVEVLVALAVAEASLLPAVGPSLIRSAFDVGAGNAARVFAMRILTALFGQLPAFAVYKGEVFAQAAILAESSDKQLADAASALCESVQLLDA